MSTLTLVLVEHNNLTMHPATRNVVTAALELGGEVALLIAGYQCKPVAEQAATIAGVNKVFYVDDARCEHPLAEIMSDLILACASSVKAIIAPATTFGKNILPRAAALLNVAQVSDVISIVNGSTFEHPIYAGNAIETVEILDEIKILTVRTTAFNPVIDSQAPCVIEFVEMPNSHCATQFINQELSKMERPDLANAKIVVAGGRGLQNAEQFKLIEQLADALGAAVGASRAAVDAGFVSNDYQVGQTGKIVAPTLYIAVGISGAVQHLAGMKDSKVIVAINKDEDAPILQIADYALVGDLFVLVPQLIEELKKR